MRKTLIFKWIWMEPYEAMWWIFRPRFNSKLDIILYHELRLDSLDILRWYENTIVPRNRFRITTEYWRHVSSLLLIVCGLCIHDSMKICHHTSPSLKGIKNKTTSFREWYHHVENAKNTEQNCKIDILVI